MKNLILMMGLPYSGKTTEARKLNAPIVSPDAIRLALHGERYLGRAEFMVWPLAVLMVRALFEAGHERVVVDATHVSRKRRDFWREQGDADWTIHIREIPTLAETCVSRAVAVGDHEIVPVIYRMSEEYEHIGGTET